MQHAASDWLIFCSRVVKTVLSNSSFIILFNLKTPNGGAFAFGQGAGWVGVHGPLFLIITLGVHVFGFGVCRMLVEVSFIHFGHFAVTLLSQLKQILGQADQLFNSLALELVSCQLCAV